MKILIVSDTHGQEKNLEEVLEKESPIDALIHLGDLEGGEDFINTHVSCPAYLVSGNNDFSVLCRENGDHALETARCFLPWSLLLCISGCGGTSAPGCFQRLSGGDVRPYP